MNTDQEKLVLGHVQHLARTWLYWRGPLDRLIDFIVYSLQTDIDRAQVDRFLRMEKTQNELRAYWETNLHRGADRLYRLICLATTDKPEVAKRRISRFPPNKSEMCSFCMGFEKGSLATIELRPEVDLAGNHADGRWLHPCCVHPWKMLRQLAENAAVDDTEKESLL